MVEVGPKSWLSRSSARERRIYDVQALLVEPPYFVAPNRMGATAAGIAPADATEVPADIEPTRLEKWLRERHGVVTNDIRPGVGGAIRRLPVLVAAELIDFITMAIEPEAWIPNDAQAKRRHDLDPDYDGDPLVRHGQWASMVFRDGALVVTAPPYVHRAIAGAAR